MSDGDCTIHRGCFSFELLHIFCCCLSRLTETFTLLGVVVFVMFASVTRFSKKD